MLLHVINFTCNIRVGGLGFGTGPPPMGRSTYPAGPPGSSYPPAPAGSYPPGPPAGSYPPAPSRSYPPGPPAGSYPTQPGPPAGSYPTQPGPPAGSYPSQPGPSAGSYPSVPPPVSCPPSAQQAPGGYYVSACSNFRSRFTHASLDPCPFLDLSNP